MTVFSPELRWGKALQAALDSLEIVGESENGCLGISVPPRAYDDRGNRA